MQVLSVASEVYPLIKTGGLADVVGALPGALAPHGVEMRVLVPGYPRVMEQLDEAEAVHDFAGLFGRKARLLRATAKGLQLLVIEAPHLYARPGNPYSDAAGRDWPDNAQRFAALSQVGAGLATGLLPDYAPAVVHAHDWQAGLLPAYLHYRGGRTAGSVITVHNLAFQGQFPRALLSEIGLPEAAWATDGVEYYGSIGFLKAGLHFADRITTVSPTYAAEIRTPEGGMGLDGLLRTRADTLSGILNGIDETVWHPARDPALAARYDLLRLDQRRANKQALQRRFGVRADPQALLCGVISRLSWQKGIDILLEALPRLIRERMQLVVLGAGEAALETGFRAAAAAAPDQVGVVVGYDEALAHLIQGGADALLVPSRFEPCGLTQLCALRYGAVPVVARVGGLADTVIDANEMALAVGVATGFQFSPVTTEALETAMGRAEAAFRRPAAWRSLQENGMRSEVGWRRPAQHYADLYRSIAAR
jgi:starch synthase